MNAPDFNPSLLQEVLGAGTIAANLLLSPLTRPWYSRWGATADEVARRLPGDELVPRPRLCCTRAVTVAAPRDQVWPWLVQLGYGRGGLYSFQRLENLAGCDMRNADRIEPQHQHLAVGDGIRLDPRMEPLPVVAVEPARYLLMHVQAGSPDGAPAAAGNTMPDGYYAQTWLFYLDEAGPHSTRLIARSRTDYRSKLLSVLVWRVVTDPVYFVMECMLLQGIRRRAEWWAWQAEAQPAVYPA